MPLSCQGQNWQGGLALTLVDSLDTLALMNRCVCRQVDCVEREDNMMRHYCMLGHAQTNMCVWEGGRRPWVGVGVKVAVGV